MNGWPDGFDAELARQARLITARRERRKKRAGAAVRKFREGKHAARRLAPKGR